MSVLLFGASVFGCGGIEPTVRTLDGGPDGSMPDANDSGMDSGPLPDITPAPQLVDLPADVVNAMGADIRAELASVAGASYSALVVMGDTGQVIFEENPDALLVPASNVKLFTTAAALDALGEDHSFAVTAYGSSEPDAGGEVDELTVVVGHDSTFSATFFASADEPLSRLAQDLRAAGVTRVTGQLLLRGEGVYNGNSLGGLDIAVERAEIAASLSSALSTSGIAAPAPVLDPSFEVPAGAAELAETRSRALHVAASHINNVSHNEMADELLRHFGYRMGGESSYLAGGREVANWLGSTDVDGAGAVFADGSGLSYDNRLSARSIVSLLRFMEGTPSGPRFQRGLSIAGMTGTLRERMTGPDTLGRVFGKTGTLNITIAVSGTLFNRHDGRPYVFSFLANGLERSQHGAVRDLLDRSVVRLARDHVSDGQRPRAPVLGCVLSDGPHASISWDTVAGASGYLVWLSDDGRVWSRAGAQLATSSPHRVSLTRPTYVRVTAIGAGGESDASDVYAVAPEQGGPGRTVLLVDGDDRFQAEPVPENPRGIHQDFLVGYGSALAGRGFDSCSNEAAASSEVVLSTYPSTVWVLGEESTDHETFSASEQALVRTYVEGGGNLLVSGAEIGWDLVERGDAADAAFYNEVLGADFVGDTAETFLVRGAASGSLQELNTMGFLDPRGVFASFPDRIAPLAGATVLLEYVGGLGGPAAVATERVVYVAFPIESLERQEDRTAVLTRALAHLER